MRKFLILLLMGSCGLVWAEPNLLKKTPGAPTEVNSDSADFDMNARRAVYRGHVVVIDPKIRLKCEWLVVDMPEAAKHVSNVSAETNVVIDFIDEKGMTNHVTAAKAVYAYSVMNSVTNETITFTGPPRPKVENQDFVLESEPLIWDRAKGHFKFEGGYKMTLKQHLDGGTNGSPLKLY